MPGCLCDLARGTMKLIIWIINIFFWVVGAFFMGVTIWLLVEGPATGMEEILHDVEDAMWITAVSLTLACACFMFVVGFLGCCGMMKDSASMILVYSILMICLVIVQCLVGVFIALAVDDVNDYLATGELGRQVQEDYGHEDYQELTQAWDDMHQNLECCGAQSYQEWEGSYWWNNEADPDQYVPNSCCSDVDNLDACQQEAEDHNPSQYLYGEGCEAKISDWADDYAIIFYCVIYILVGVEILCVVFGFVGYCNLKEGE